MANQNKQLRRFSFLLWENEDLKLDNSDRKLFIDNLKKVCKHWVFQLERGTESGKLHFQGRFSFDQPKRRTEVPKLFPGFESISIKIEGDEEASSFYVMKERTRIDGPWSDKDVETYIPRQVREITQLRPWQQYIVDHAKDWDTRHINVVLDMNGNIGKSTLVSYIRAYNIGRKLPFCNDYKDIMRMVMDMPTSSLYLIDMPRAINKDRLQQMYSGIETIKDGYAYDDRYSFKEKLFDCPNIWVFTNIRPDENLLSRDRWIIWDVVDNNLVKQDFVVA